jgi:hypothetical protein
MWSTIISMISGTWNGLVIMMINLATKKQYTSALSTTVALRPYLSPKKSLLKIDLGNQSDWIFISFGISSVIWLMMVLVPKIDRPELTRFESGTPIKKMAT